MAMQLRNKLAGPALVVADDSVAAESTTNHLVLKWQKTPATAVSHEGLTLDPRVVSLLGSLFEDPEIIERLAVVFETQVQKTISTRSQELMASDLERVRDPLWLLDEVQYMGYVNFMGSADGTGTFENVSGLLDYVMSDVGARVLYTLPFLASPFGDAGFDVSDYRSVDSRFGGTEQFRAFRSQLAAKGGSLQMDLVLNHVSVEHEWAKRVLAGETEYRDLFHVLDRAPHVLKVLLDSGGLPLSAQYLERDRQGNEKVVERRVVFPAFADPAHPHYTKTKDADGQEMWVYHTFYPFQWDLNFTHPRIFEETLDILGYWANEGADLLRLDAIPHLYKQMESDPRIMKVVELLRYFIAKAAPRTSLIVEANQSPSVVYKYFGDPAAIEVEHLGQKLQTSAGAQVAYNFDQTIHSWASLLSGDKRYLLEGLRRTPKAPENTLWANFLRVHDELSLSKAPDEIRDVIQRELIETKRGVPFRGARGVGGRMANFLDHDPRRQKMAFAHLLSLNGHPIVYYGDEVMATSDSAYAQAAALARGGQYDSRDEGRGPIAREVFEAARAAGGTNSSGDVLAHLRHLIAVRQDRISLRRGDLKEVETGHQGVVAYLRTVDGQESTLVVFNLTGQIAETTIQVEVGASEVLDLISREKVVIAPTENRGASASKSGERKLTLAPYQTHWLEV